MNMRRATMNDFAQIVTILNDVTLDLHKKGINQWAYPWESETIKEDVINNHSFVLEADGKIIGIFFICDIDTLSELVTVPASKYLYRIAILPEYQGTGMGRRITDFARSYAKEMDKPLFLDCWAGNVKLKQFYSDQGFAYVGDFPEEDYFISVFTA